MEHLRLKLGEVNDAEVISKESAADDEEATDRVGEQLLRKCVSAKFVGQR
jgi:hypothetical protein